MPPLSEKPDEVRRREVPRGVHPRRNCSRVEFIRVRMEVHPSRYYYKRKFIRSPRRLRSPTPRRSTLPLCSRVSPSISRSLSYKNPRYSNRRYKNPRYVSRTWTFPELLVPLTLSSVRLLRRLRRVRCRSRGRRRCGASWENPTSAEERLALVLVPLTVWSSVRLLRRLRRVRCRSRGRWRCGASWENPTSAEERLALDRREPLRDPLEVALRDPLGLDRRVLDPGGPLDSGPQELISVLY